MPRYWRMDKFEKISGKKISIKKSDQKIIKKFEIIQLIQNISLWCSGLMKSPMFSQLSLLLPEWEKERAIPPSWRSKPAKLSRLVVVVVTHPLTGHPHDEKGALKIGGGEWKMGDFRIPLLLSFLLEMCSNHKALCLSHELSDAPKNKEKKWDVCER